MFKTIRDIAFEANRMYPAFTLPAGTVVQLIKGADGIKGDLWAVRDSKVIADLTGNTHDPKYRYTWVQPGDVVEVVEPTTEAQRALREVGYVVHHHPPENGRPPYFVALPPNGGALDTFPEAAAAWGVCEAHRLNRPARPMANAAEWLASLEAMSGHDWSAEEREGAANFLASKRSETITHAQALGWWIAHRRAYAEGVLASIQAAGGEPDCPQPQFSAYWEAWGDGVNDHGAGHFGASK